MNSLWKWVGNKLLILSSVREAQCLWLHFEARLSDRTTYLIITKRCAWCSSTQGWWHNSIYIMVNVMINRPIYWYHHPIKCPISIKSTYLNAVLHKTVNYSSTSFTTICVCVSICIKWRNIGWVWIYSFWIVQTCL